MVWFKSYRLYVIVIAVLLILGACEPLASQWLRFDRALMEPQQQWWRLLSAHWVHLSFAHLLGNVLAVGVFGYMAGDSLNNRYGVLLLIWSTLWVGLGLYWYADYLERYVGFSGILHGVLLVAPCVSRHYSTRMATLIVCGIVLKVLWEQSPWYDDMASYEYLGGRVEVNAHLFGALSGLTYLLMAWVYTRIRPNSV